MKTLYVKIKGIQCDSCRNKLIKALSKIGNVTSVKIDGNIATLNYDGTINNYIIIKTINDLGYYTKKEYMSDVKKDIDDIYIRKQIAVIFLIILLIWFVLFKIFNINIFNVFPTVSSKVSYGYLFIVGILTSFHCLSMCGAFNLLASYNLESSKAFKNPLLYNIGRICSYTILGGLVGLIGSVFTVNNTVQGIIILVSSIIIILMALSMLGLLSVKPLNLKIKNKFSNPFMIGFLNGFMPCGPLQSMQLYALMTGSFFRGALSMFFFSIGTVPLMLTAGFIYSSFKGKWRILITRIASVLILFLVIFMFNRGLSTLGVNFNNIIFSNNDYLVAKMENDYQVVRFSLDYNNYQDIQVKKGTMIKMIIDVSEKYLNGCNERLEIKAFGVEATLQVGENVIEFTPDKTGTFTFNCWMNMITNNIKVVDN